MSALHPAVLIIDDDPQVHRYLRPAMIAAGYRPSEIGGRDFQLDRLIDEPPDAVVLDLDLRELDGIALLKIIRAHFDGPVVILSTLKREIRLIEAIDLGADNFVAKPFFTDELLARLRVVFRRRILSAGREPVVEAGGFKVDMVNRSVTAGHKRVSLSESQYFVLSKLAEAGGGVVTHDQLMHGEGGPAKTMQNVRLLVRQLRKKLEADPRAPNTIKTVNHVGYRLDLDRD